MLFLFISLFSQKRYEHNFEIKTNLLNLIALGPSAGLEFSLQNNCSIMISLASGKIDYGDFGGITKYKTSTLELRKYSTDKIFFAGPYLKNISKQCIILLQYFLCINISKQVFWQESVIAGIIPIGKDRDFIGNGFSLGATTGFKLPVSKKIRLEMSSQIGYGHYYRMADKNNNFPSGNYVDARIALWLGFML